MKKAIIALLMLTLNGCANMPMDRVMSRCDIGTNIENFSFYTYCVKTTYSKEGNKPNSAATRAFYSQLDVIDENYRQRKITNAEAKAYAYRAWQLTIDADNRSAESTGLNQMMQGLAIMGGSGGGTPQQAPTQNQNTQVCAYDQWGNKGSCFLNMQSCILFVRTGQGGQCH